MLLDSCKEPVSGTNVESNSISQIMEVEKISIGHFDNIPDSIEGCGDFYLLDSSDLSSNKYVFVSELSKLGAIMLNGRCVYLDKNEVLSKESDDSFKDVYIRDNFKVVLDAKRYKEYDEGGFYKGTLTISVGDSTIVYQVHGQTGC